VTGCFQPYCEIKVNRLPTGNVATGDAVLGQTPPADEPARPVHRRRLVALLLILVGGTLAIDARAVIRFGDGIAARAHARETMKWIRANDAAGDAGRAAPSQARGSVIAPGREGYLLLIPRIGVRLVVRELEVEVFSGRNTPTLRRHGLGQVPYTHQLRNVSPGGDGTAAITGHRTTSGAPFRNIDRLRPGDLIIIRKGSVEQQWAVEGECRRRHQVSSGYEEARLARVHASIHGEGAPGCQGTPQARDSINEPGAGGTEWALEHQ
jgi:hypothetical protein